MTPDPAEFEFGVESDDRADATARYVTPDIWAYVGDGEFAVSWAFERVDPQNIKSETHFHKAGIDEVDPDSDVRWFAVDPEVPTREWARKYAGAHVDSLSLARSFFAALDDSDQGESE